MQLSSRILTALAVLILAVAVVAVRAGSPGTVEAATGTIDVLNVGTCYATDGEVFGASDCVDGDDNVGDNEGYEVTGRDDVSEVATVFATYSHDPKTAPDSPRAVLENSNLIKISIADPGRDKRTPVLLPVGTAPAANAPLDCEGDACVFSREDVDETTDDESGYLQIIQKEYKDLEGVTEATMSWQRRNVTTEAVFTIDSPGVETGITIIRSDVAIEYMPMDVADDSLISFWGRIDPDGDGVTEPGALINLKGQLKLDEDVGPGGTGDMAKKDQASRHG